MLTADSHKTTKTLELHHCQLSATNCKLNLKIQIRKIPVPGLQPAQYEQDSIIFGGNCENFGHTCNLPLNSHPSMY